MIVSENDDINDDDDDDDNDDVDDEGNREELSGFRRDVSILDDDDNDDDVFDNRLCKGGSDVEGSISALEVKYDHLMTKKKKKKKKKKICKELLE
jgi:hypothetical protein